jgi:hypothetical protein
MRWVFQFMLLGAALGSLPGSFSATRSTSIILGTLAGALCGAVVTLGVLPWMQQRALRKAGGLAGAFEARVDRQGLTLCTEDGREMTRRWMDLGRVSPDRDHLFLYWKDGQVTLIPRRALAAETGEADLRALIHGKGKATGTPGKNGASRGNQPGLELRVERAPEDLALFAWHQNLHDPALRLRTWFSYAVVTGMTIYLSAAALPWWGAVLAGLGASSLLPRLYYGLLKRQGALMLRQAGHREVIVRLDAAGVTESAGGSAAKIRWADVARIEETPELVLIYVDRLQALVLPRRSLGDDGEAHLERIKSWYTADRVRQTGVKAKR